MLSQERVSNFRSSSLELKRKRKGIPVTMKPIKIRLQVRRFDLAEEPLTQEKTIELDGNSDYKVIKAEIQKVCNIEDIEGKVIKIRNQDYALVPASYMLDDIGSSCDFIVDITKTTCTSAPQARPIQDAYLNAIRKNLVNMESRVTQAERLIPQLQWRRQAHMEQTVSSMASRVAFLNRRIDELVPPQWKSKVPQTMA